MNLKNQLLSISFEFDSPILQTGEGYCLNLLVSSGACVLFAAFPVTFEACSPIVTLGPYLLGGPPCKFKLDFPQSDSDRGELLLEFARAVRCRK